MEDVHYDIPVTFLVWSRRVESFPRVVFGACMTDTTEYSFIFQDYLKKPSVLNPWPMGQIWPTEPCHLVPGAPQGSGNLRK